MRRLLSSVFVVLTSSLYMHCDATTSLQAHSRRLLVNNVAGAKVAVEWIHPVTGDVIPLHECAAPGETISFESFVNHTLLFRDLSSNNVTSTFTVSPDDKEQVVLIQEGLILERMELTTPTTARTASSSSSMVQKNDDVSKMANTCRHQASGSLAHGSSAKATMAELVDCLTKGTANILVDMNEELAYQRELRQTLAHAAENYTCSDPTMETTKPIYTAMWSYEGTTRKVGVLHKHINSHIHVLHDFISSEECQAIEEAAKPLLHRGTVADGKGGSMLSQNRKAWQAGIAVKDFSDKNDPIANVKRRLFAYANDAVGFNMSLVGQEDIMSIQYFGNNDIDEVQVNAAAKKVSGTRTTAENDSSVSPSASPDQYMPHCDGDCTSTPHKTGGRVATMVMYCDVPAAGSGATNFQQANVYVKPQRGAAVFFSYMNPTTGIHDEGFTTHSGCPVRSGTKRIAVQWMRVGVDAENPWDSFDTNNIKKT